VDFSAGRALSELQRDLADNDIALALIVVSTQRRDQLEDSGLIDLAEATRIFDSREACLAAYLAERPADETVDIENRPVTREGP
jgi:MFS superfamily sulfate permease-like transporter